MNLRWVTLDHYTSAASGAHTVIARLHVADELGEFAFRCGHVHRSEDTARRCAAEQWPDAEVRA
ncbi:hypothetical protein [Microbacterium sp. LM3X-1.2]|uniref:hypothetical protein n=1 Tax=Microbacterium sp. LM3X-1.2 TaxID=3135251 RepID=UPI003414C040